MIITLSPSVDGDEASYPTLSIDTRTNVDKTREVVDAALSLITAAGHDRKNVDAAALSVAMESRRVA